LLKTGSLCGKVRLAKASLDKPETLQKIAKKTCFICSPNPMQTEKRRTFKIGSSCVGERVVRHWLIVYGVYAETRDTDFQYFDEFPKANVKRLADRRSKLA